MTATLNLSEVASFKAELETLLEQLKAESAEQFRRQQQAENPEVHDVGDEAAAVTSLLVNVESISHQNEEIAECLEALARIENGDFGFCIDCDEEIELTRLKACPTASRCIRCQSVHEAGVRKTA
ncbi:TraR/DksA family transcriptional regulator [Neptuniibacter halophilus]|uniref:TraR/DksA family transcriptional regulator n=1 Tax=Neptuniibacter halophilus TaxID=651666 RepID=UPI002574409B|nr:TraR/DksA family transcriptional regulator [Neptuniibacter halophilus]